jgi:hypothetical protein
MDQTMSSLRFLSGTTLVLFAQTAGATPAYNCDASYQAIGRVSEVLLGVDDKNDKRISFTFVNEATKLPTTISVHNKIDTADGQAAYSMLLTAFTTRSRVQIDRCTSKELTALRLFDS